MSTLLTLGHGYSAQALARLLIPQGWQVIGTARTPERADELLATGVRPLIYPGDLGSALARASHILISAAPDMNGDIFLQSHRDQIVSAPATWVGYLSTTAVYGDHQGAWVDEDTPCVPVAERSHARLSAEQAWSECAADMAAELDILRLSGIYGPQRNALANLREGTARRIIKPGQVFNRIHVADIADAIAACVARGQPGRIYNVTDDEPAPPQDVVEYAAKLLGVAPPPERDFATTEMTPMARSFYGENKRVSNKRIKSELGFEFARPTYREGLQALLTQGEGR